MPAAGILRGLPSGRPRFRFGSTAGREALLRGIALIGLSGAGKTTVAPLLAGLIEGAWIDLDRAVEESAGSTVAQLIESRGEPAFRVLESDALRRALEAPSSRPWVVACGAGVLGRPANRDLLRAAAFVAWLSVKPETATERLGAGADRIRPLLRGATAVERLRALEAERRELYAAAADVTVETDGRDAREVAAFVAQAWRGRRDEWEPSGS